MPSINVKRFLSFLLALCIVFSLLPLAVFATETDECENVTEPQVVIEQSTEPTVEEVLETTVPIVSETVPAVVAISEEATPKMDANLAEDAFAQLMVEMDAILLEYLGETEMAEEKVTDAVIDMSWDDMHTALEKLNALEPSITVLTEDEIIQLEEIYEGRDTIVCFYETLHLATTPTLYAATGTHTPVTGVTVDVSGATDNSMTNGEITVTAKGSAGLFGIGASAKTATITIYNKSENTATLSFDWTATSINQLTIDGTVYTGASGTFSKILDAGASFTAQIVTAKNATVNTLVMKNFSLVKAGTAFNITFEFDSGTLTVGGEAVTNGKTVAVDSAGKALVASATNIIGWVNKADNKLIGIGNNFTFTPVEDNITVKAIHSTAPRFWVGGEHLYETLAKAITAANSGNLSSNTVILANSGTLPAGDYEIPSGVTLLIPFDDANTIITDNMSNYLADESPIGSEYRRLTMESGATIVVNGAICIGSKAYKLMTGQSGDYGVIEMNGSSNITVNSSGTLYAYGYIFHGSNGSGTVTVNGGTVYESAFIMDYPGNITNTKSIYDASVFPMRAITARNVEVPMTFSSSAKEYLFYSIYGTQIFGSYPGYMLFIGSTTNATGTFILEENTTLTKSYKDGVQKFSANGDIALNTLNIDLKLGGYGSTSVSSATTSGFPLPSGYLVELTSGELTLNDNLIMTEGSKVIIGNEATVNTNEKNIYILDSQDDAGTKSGTDVHGIAYTIVDSDAVLDVNGTLIASGGFYTSTNGAAIISSEGTGVIKVTGTSSATEVKIRTGEISGTPTTCSITPAKLLNGDGTYLATAETGAETYVYSGTGTNGKWYKRVIAGTSVRAGDCLDIYFYVTGLEGNGYTAKITRNGEVEKEIPSSEWLDADSYRRFAYTGIAAKEMTDMISVTIYEGDNVVSETATESIESYALRTLEKNTNTYLQTTLVDMLNYGADAQTYFGHNADNLANADLTDAQKKYGTQTDAVITETMKSIQDTSEVTFAGASVTAETTLYLSFYFEGITAQSVSNFKAVITYTDHYGTSKTRNIAGSSFVSKSGYYGPRLTGLAIADGRQIVNCKIYNGNTLVAEAEASVEGYAAQTIKTNSGDVNLVNVCKTLMKFVDSAKAYFNSSGN